MWKLLLTLISPQTQHSHDEGCLPQYHSKIYSVRKTCPPTPPAPPLLPHKGEEEGKHRKWCMPVMAAVVVVEEEEEEGENH